MRLFLFLLTFSSSIWAQQNSFWQQSFAAIYKPALGEVSPCNRQDQEQQEGIFRVCSNSLKNAGNAPYVMYHGKRTDKVAVLFHGLSDSPFFFRDIAKRLFDEGHNVVVALLPGHGLKDADAAISADDLQIKWDHHAEQIMAFSRMLGDKRIMGGFSTGGAIATHYILSHPEEADGLMLFSGALQLQDNFEFMAKIWGIKWLTKWLEGDYQESGANPYKYSKVHGYSAVVLMDEIFAIRDLIEQGERFSLPLFIAHSEADTTTLLAGVEWLAEQNQAQTQRYIIAKAVDVCHADLVVSQAQIEDMQFDQSQLSQPIEKCWVPQANPEHKAMLDAMANFFEQL